MAEALRRWKRARASRCLGLRIPRTWLPHHYASITDDCVCLAVPGLPGIPRAGLVCEKSATPRSVNIT